MQFDVGGLVDEISPAVDQDPRVVRNPGVTMTR
jgi:hypothetical protein